MDDSKLSYIISSLAPADVNEKMWDIRKKFHLNPPYKKQYSDSVITINNAHLTVKRRFYLRPTTTEDQLIKAIDSVEKRTITIHASNLALYQHEPQGTSEVSNVLVAVADKTPQIQKLHEDLLSRISPYIEDYGNYEGLNYNPHLSIIYAIPDELTSDIKTYAENHFLPISYTLNNFYLLKNIPGITRERSLVKAYEF